MKNTTKKMFLKFYSLYGNWGQDRNVFAITRNLKWKNTSPLFKNVKIIDIENNWLKLF